MAVPLIVWGLAAVGGYLGLDGLTNGASSEVLKKTGGKFVQSFTEASAEVAEERGVSMLNAFAGQDVQTTSTTSTQFTNTASQTGTTNAGQQTPDNQGGGILDLFMNMGWGGRAATSVGLVTGIYKLWNMFGGGQKDSSGSNMFGFLLKTTAMLAVAFLGGNFLQNQFNSASGVQEDVQPDLVYDMGMHNE